MTAPPASLLAFLTRHMDEIAQAWVRSQTSTLPPGMTEGELETQARLLLDEMVRMLEESVPSPRADLEFVALLSHLSQQRTRQGFTPSQTAHFLLGVRPAFLPVLLRESASNPQSLLPLLADLCRLVDELTLALFEIHLQGRVGWLPVLTESPDELPLIEAWPALLVLPLAEGWGGAPERATTLLETVVARGARALLLDFAAVRAMEEEAAAQWTQTIRALRLLGIAPLLMGLSAPVAQALAQAGLEPG